METFKHLKKIEYLVEITINCLDEPSLTRLGGPSDKYEIKAQIHESPPGSPTKDFTLVISFLPLNSDEFNF